MDFKLKKHNPCPVSSISHGLHGLPGLCREESIGLTNAVHKWVFISNLERAWEMAVTPSDTQHYHPKSPHALVGQTNDRQLPKCTIYQLYLAASGSVGQGRLISLISSPDLDWPLTWGGSNSAGVVGLILGRSSQSLQGLKIHPGVIDEDCVWVIKVLVQLYQTWFSIHPS